ncbi:hypothetical protein FACS189485_06630 [Spirochaetia bacterium]|nr:hypothetical protein FACS189485_06630 [Spirochaetia bacterium]
MQKIVFCNIMMKARLDRFRYKVSGNSTIAFDGEVIFPINGVLAKTLNKDDSVKVVLLKKDDINNNSDRNVGEFMRELNIINKGIGAAIDYKVLSTPHDESRVIQEKLLKEMVDELTDDAAIYADITYGPKSMPIIVFSVLNFAEKFFNADIKNIVYGKVDFDRDNNPVNPELFDMTPLFYLNSLANTMECEDSDQAKKLLASILAS